MDKRYFALSRRHETVDDWKVFTQGNVPQNDGWITWDKVQVMAKSLNYGIPAEYWSCSNAVMVTFAPKHLNLNKTTSTGLRLRTMIDIAFAEHVTAYKTRNDIISKIFAQLEEQELGDWITEDTGRKYELTFIPTKK